jgi:hypothetical protein
MAGLLEASGLVQPDEQSAEQLTQLVLVGCRKPRP